MTRSPRLTRRFPVAVTDKARRTLGHFAAESGLPEDHALSFLLENLPGLLREDVLAHRLRAYKALLPQDPVPDAPPDP